MFPQLTRPPRAPLAIADAAFFRDARGQVEHRAAVGAAAREELRRPAEEPSVRDVAVRLGLRVLVAAMAYAIDAMRECQTRRRTPNRPHDDDVEACDVDASSPSSPRSRRRDNDTRLLELRTGSSDASSNASLGPDIRTQYAVVQREASPQGLQDRVVRRVAEDDEFGRSRRREPSVAVEHARAAVGPVAVVDAHVVARP